jgi:hypothetical protein
MYLNIFLVYYLFLHNEHVKMSDIAFSEDGEIDSSDENAPLTNDNAVANVASDERSLQHHRTWLLNEEKIELDMGKWLITGMSLTDFTPQVIITDCCCYDCQSTIPGCGWGNDKIHLTITDWENLQNNFSSKTGTIKKDIGFFFSIYPCDVGTMIQNNFNCEYGIKLTPIQCSQIVDMKEYITSKLALMQKSGFDVFYNHCVLGIGHLCDVLKYEANQKDIASQYIANLDVAINSLNSLWMHEIRLFHLNKLMADVEQEQKDFENFFEKKLAWREA